ncbi:MAG: hypothetical protein IJE48_02495 [Clostridia bacterium]|nr:hypothetical protein [Clostridia bacterium]
MRNRVFIFLSGIAFFVLIFLFSEEFSSGFSAGLSNCAEVVIPSLFPFLAASSLAGSGRLPHKIQKLSLPLTKRLFGLDGSCLPAIILSQLGGYLSGVSAAKSLYESGTISRSQARRLILFCISPGVGFSVNAVGNALLGSREAGKILLLSVCVSSVLTGCFTRFLHDSEEKRIKSKTVSISFSSALVGSVQSSASAMLSCCGFVCFFSGISSVMSRIIGNNHASLAAACILEVTSGCASATGKVSLPAIAAVCAFGGLCVHLQIFSLAKDIGIRISSFFLFRLLHSALAFVVCRLILCIHPVEKQVMISVSENIQLWSFSAPAAISLMFLCVLLILDLDNSKKLC